MISLAKTPHLSAKQSNHHIDRCVIMAGSGFASRQESLPGPAAARLLNMPHTNLYSSLPACRVCKSECTLFSCKAQAPLLFAHCRNACIIPSHSASHCPSCKWKRHAWQALTMGLCQRSTLKANTKTLPPLPTCSPALTYAQESHMSRNRANTNRRTCWDRITNYRLNWAPQNEQRTELNTWLSMKLDADKQREAQPQPSNLNTSAHQNHLQLVVLISQTAQLLQHLRIHNQELLVLLSLPVAPSLLIDPWASASDNFTFTAEWKSDGSAQHLMSFL